MDEPGELNAGLQRVGQTQLKQPLAQANPVSTQGFRPGGQHNPGGRGAQHQGPGFQLQARQPGGLSSPLCGDSGDYPHLISRPGLGLSSDHGVDQPAAGEGGPFQVEVSHLDERRTWSNAGTFPHVYPLNQPAVWRGDRKR